MIPAIFFPSAVDPPNLDKISNRQIKFLPKFLPLRYLISQRASSSCNKSKIDVSSV